MLPVPTTHFRAAGCSGRHSAQSATLAAPARLAASGRASLGAAAAAAAAGAARPRRSMTRVQAAGGDGGSGKTSVLFVCLGNICRSPSAEAMFRSVVEKAGLAEAFDIDSCGTGGGSSNWFLPGGFSYHEGDAADSRMTAAAAKRGVRLTSRSRPLVPSDLCRFDYIIGMDGANTAAILKAAAHWAGSDDSLPGLEAVRGKVSLMTRYCRAHEGAREVPDPYYGGPAGFERVLDLLEDASTGLLQHIQAEQAAR